MSKGRLIRWNFSFTGSKIFLSTVSFQHLIRAYSCKMWMKFVNLQSWKYFRIKNFYQISDKNLFFWNTFHDQRSSLYWKWRKWLMWDEHERRNEWKFKNIRITRKQKNQNNKTDYKKKSRKLWKWIVIGGNFFIISKIINWVTSQFLNERILDPCII